MYIVFNNKEIIIKNNTNKDIKEICGNSFGLHKIEDSSNNIRINKKNKFTKNFQ